MTKKLSSIHKSVKELSRLLAIEEISEISLQTEGVKEFW
jgi:hypothetical protein